jgi:TonB family protein
MSARTTLLTVMCLVGLRSAFFAEETQKHADAMMQRAREFSDIRSPGAPAFRLRATFSFTGEDLETIQGTFTEGWVSNSQWRRETVANDFRRVEVGGSSRLWLLDEGKNFPVQAIRVSGLVEIFPARSAKFEFESIMDRNAQDSSTECAITRAAGQQKEKSAFCFDKRSGGLVEKISPEPLRNRAADYACQYGAFQEFGNYSFPREIDCFLDGHRKLQVNIVELSAEPSPNTALFTPPAGAIEMGNCSVKPEPPRPVSTPDPRFPMGSRDHSAMVTLSLIIDAKGKTQEVRVTRSGGKPFDDQAASTVRGWRFKPATCNGEPVGTQISVEINYQLR